MDFYIGLGIGLFVGCFVGFVGAALCVISKAADNHMEKKMGATNDR